MKEIILGLWFMFLFGGNAHATTIYPWESRIETCSSATDGTDHAICLDSTTTQLFKCRSSDGTCTLAIVGNTATLNNLFMNIMNNQGGQQ